MQNNCILRYLPEDQDYDPEAILSEKKILYQIIEFLAGQQRQNING